jgi:hypothetical protein
MSVEVIKKTGTEVPKEWRDMKCEAVWFVIVEGRFQAVFFDEADAMWYARAVELSIQEELENDNRPEPPRGPKMR